MKIVRVVGEPSASLSPFDRGFSLGDAIFETVRVYGGKPFRLQQHLERLRRSALHMAIPIPAKIGAEIDSVLAKSAALRIPDARLRITLSRGVAAAPGLAVAEGMQPTLVLTVDPIATPARTSIEGITAVMAKSRRNEQSATAGHKTVAFADAILELSRARESGAADCVFLDTQGHISEASTSNVFVYDGESLITPALSCGALPGITRSCVLELASRMAVPIEERMIEKDELPLGLEAFLTSSVREIVPLVRIDGLGIGGGRTGDLTAELVRRYRELVVAETE